MKENNIFVIYHTSLHGLMDTFIRADSKEEAGIKFEQVRREEKMKLFSPPIGIHRLVVRA